MKLMFLSLCFLVACPKASPPETPDEQQSPAVAEVPEETQVDPNLNIGQQFWSWFAEENFQAIFDNSSPAVQGGLPVEVWQGLSQQIAGTFGGEVEVIEEEVTPYQDLFIYARTSKFENNHLLSTFVFSSDGLLQGAQFVPAPVVAESRFLDYETKTDIVIPFTGDWTVYWGGRTVEQNYHAAYSDQRFALDIVIEIDGKTYETDGVSNEDYYAFGQPISAPGSGLVVSMENDVPDSVPGELGSEGEFIGYPTPLGNHVIIDHGNGEFSFLAHFKQGSVTVAVGDEVTAGQPIAECGNSGNTSEPHLHYHLQTTEIFSEGEGLPIQFQNYTSNGEAVERGELEQGQLISP